MKEPLLLHLQGLSKRFVSPVLIDADFDVHLGEVHAIIGAEGAGKSTLAHIICGLTQPDAGAMAFAGQPFAPQSRLEAEEAGIQLIPQQHNLVESHSVADNIFLRRFSRRLGLVDYRHLHVAAHQALEAVGLEGLDPALPAGLLSDGEKQLVEIVTALTQDCRLLVLDELTTALMHPQAGIFFEHIARLKREGVGVIYISRRLEELRRVADRITILRDGRVVASEAATAFTLKDLVQGMAEKGAMVPSWAPKPTKSPVALRVENLRLGTRVQDVSFDVRQGEILGLAGLSGSGRTETLRAILGATRPDAGRICLGETLSPVTLASPQDAARAGIGMFREEGPLSSIGHTNRGFTLGNGEELPITNDAMVVLESLVTDSLNVQHTPVLPPLFAPIGLPFAEVDIGLTSDLVLDDMAPPLAQAEQERLRACNVLLADEPTRGVDPSHRHTIYQRLGELASEGKALVFVSSDLRELMDLCDRIAVISAGKVVQTFDRAVWSHDAIMAAAMSEYLHVGQPKLLH